MERNFYCPRKECENHLAPPENKEWYRPFSHYMTKIRGVQPRYQCKKCRKTFSPMTFSIDYYVKRRISYRTLLNQQISASGINDMARQMKCTTETVQNRIRRFSHQIQGSMALYLHNHKIREDLSADGLESFVESQFFPTNINILVGSKSQFIYFFDSYYFKRKGRMTEEQKEKKNILYKKACFEEKSPSKSFNGIIDQMDKIWDRNIKKTLLFDTDENPVYQSVMKKHKAFQEAIESETFMHRLTNSREERNRKNKLFPCNYCDRMVRKDLAEHVRETVQFARDQNCSMERFSLYTFWLNFIKPYRIKPTSKKKPKTHGEAAKITKEIRKDILRVVWKGDRITFEMAYNVLTPYNKKLWKNRLITPTGKLNRALPNFMLV